MQLSHSSAFTQILLRKTRRKKRISRSVSIAFISRLTKWPLQNSNEISIFVMRFRMPTSTATTRSRKMICL